MLDHEMRDQGPPLVYDNTMDTTFLGCQRKFYWWWRGFDYLLRPGYFSFGSAWGLIKASWYQSQAKGHDVRSKDWWMEAAKALQAGYEFWDQAGSPDDDRGNSRKNLRDLWKLYLASYPTEPFDLVKGGAEVGWIWPLAGTKYFLAGALDGYVRWSPYGMLVLEEKTAGIWLSDNYIRGWSFSSQVTQYDWFLKQLVSDEEVFGVLVNMTCKRITKAKREWCENAAVGTSSPPESGTPQFARTLQERTPEQLAEFERDWLRNIENFHRSWDRWHFPKTKDSINCVGGIGKAPCLYQGLCLSGIPTAELNPLQFPNIVLKEKKWTPWERGTPDVSGPIEAKPAKDALPELWERIKRRPI